MDVINSFLDDLQAFASDLIAYDYAWTIGGFFHSLDFDDYFKLVIVYLLILWASIIIWVTKDIINRTNNIFLQIFSILTVLVWTPFGIVVYLLIRPSQTLFEKHYEEIEFEEENYTDRLLEEIEGLKTEMKEHVNCFNCNYSVSEDFKFCPNCRTALKKVCISCENPIENDWTHCPFCGKDQEDKVNKILENIPVEKKEGNKPSKKSKKKKK